MDGLRKKGREFLISILPGTIRKEIVRRDALATGKQIHYSQEGEDIILQRYFGKKDKGFYVDIGAHHPQRFSNTYLFYLKGWNGINVDAMPGSMEAFKKLRPRDVNLEVPVSSTHRELTYYVFNEPALNTFSEEEVAKKDGKNDYRVIQKIPLQTRPLGELLEQHVPKGMHIDFMSVDVEGLDYDVLSSNNWNLFQPTMMVVESLRNSLEEIFQTPVYQFLHGKGYILVAKTFNTLFFKKG